jgi:hypothetical protein
MISHRRFSWVPGAGTSGGWLLALRNAPLTDFARFLLHVVLVFVFMFLLMASTHPGCLLWTLAVIFFLYLLSDLLTMRAHGASRPRAEEHCEAMHLEARGRPHPSRRVAIARRRRA